MREVTFDSGGNVEQQFSVVRGSSGAPYLHDGLNAFRKVTPECGMRNEECGLRSAHPASRTAHPELAAVRD